MGKKMTGGMAPMPMRGPAMPMKHKRPAPMVNTAPINQGMPMNNSAPINQTAPMAPGGPIPVPTPGSPSGY